MSNAMTKLGPLAGFLAAVGYCIWPYASPTTTTVATAPRLPEIEADWLRPDLGPPSGRDPFRPGGAPLPTPARTPTVADGAGPKSPGASPAAPQPARDGPSPGFRLGGTLVAGDRRLAIIDGRVYRQGELVEGAGPADGGWRVDRVEAGRVLLARPRRGAPLALEFPDPLAAMAEAPPPSGRRPVADGTGFGIGLGVRSVLAAAGIPMPEPGILEQLADQSGGSLPGAYRALLNLLVSPPRPGASPGAVTSPGTGEGGPR